jgi:peptidyl-prolyl cis-trans isomerase B (cyclophilin B)
MTKIETKNKMRQIALLSVLVVFFVSCGEKPEADFRWAPLEPVAGETVKFTNLSQNAKSYSWNFGDMSIGSEANPTHVYKKSGTYIVDLRAHNGLRSHEKTVNIVVK